MNPTRESNSLGSNFKSCLVCPICLQFGYKQTLAIIIIHINNTGADPGFLERGFVCIMGWGFALLIVSIFS